MGRDPNTPGPRLLLVIAPPPRKDEPVKSARREPANGILQCTHVCPDSNLWIAQLRGFGAARRVVGILAGLFILRHPLIAALTVPPSLISTLVF